MAEREMRVVSAADFPIRFFSSLLICKSSSCIKRWTFCNLLQSPLPSFWSSDFF